MSLDIHVLNICILMHKCFPAADGSIMGNSLRRKSMSDSYHDAELSRFGSESEFIFSTYFKAETRHI